MPNDQPTKNADVLDVLDPLRIDRLTERLAWKYDGNTIQRHISCESREKALELLAWLSKRVSRTTLDLCATQKGQNLDISLTPTGTGFTTNDLRLARHVNSRASTEPKTTP